MKMLTTEKDNVLDQKVTLEFTVRELAYIVGNLGYATYDQVKDDAFRYLCLCLTKKDIESAEESVINPLIDAMMEYLKK